MKNLSLGLAQIISWIASYTFAYRWLVNLFGFEGRHLVAAVIIFILWWIGVTVFKRIQAPMVVGPAYILLALSNFLSIITLIVIAYNYHSDALVGPSMSSVEEIMSEPFLVIGERHLISIYPFVNFAIFSSTVYLGISIARSLWSKKAK